MWLELHTLECDDDSVLRYGKACMPVGCYEELFVMKLINYARGTGVLPLYAV